MQRPCSYSKEINLLFTDLDETLLDANYNIKEDAVERILLAYKKNFVIIFASSKTLAEEQYYSINLGIPITYIVENGSAIYLPENCFENISHKKGCRKFELTSVRIDTLISILRKIASIYPELKFYSNSTIDEIRLFTGLPGHLVELALKREYTETIFKGYNPSIERTLKEKGLCPQKGSKFVTIGGNVNKGKAAQFLINLFIENNYSPRRIIGIGDGENDIPLLKVVNEAYVVGNKISLPGARAIKSFTDIPI